MFRLRNVKARDIIHIEDLEIPAKQITCVVGESGSGKTTLLRLLNQMVSSDEGEIWFNGQPIEQIDPVLLRRKVVMLPQQPVMFDGNVRDNLLVGLSFAERPPAGDEQLRQMLRFVHLDKELDDHPESFSGGEKQRLGLARVLLLDADVLLLDEPTSALDDHTAREVMKNVAEHCKTKGKTVIMITHSRQLADEFADCVIELHQGKISAVRLECTR